MTLLPSSLRVRSPSLEQARGDCHLMVWGDLAQWLVVDRELHDFLGLLDGRVSVGAAVAMHARRLGKPVALVEREVPAILAELERRNLIDHGPVPSVAGESIRISNVTVNITNRCNLRCAFCYNRDRHSDEVPVSVFLDALTAGRSVFSPEASLIVLGGEPFLDLPRLLEMIDGANRLFATPCLVSTNGTRIRDGAVESLAARKVEVQISIDSPRPEQHDALRGAGTFQAAVDGAQRLAQAGVHTIISSVLGVGPLDDMEPMLDLARTLGAKEARFIPVRAVGAACTGAPRPGLARAFEYLVGILRRRPELRPLLGRDVFSILHQICGHAQARASCGIGRRVIFVDADGTVYPCPNHLRPEFACGNLAHQDLAHIVFASVPMNLLRARHHVDDYPKCRGCSFRYWCAGDCRGEVLASTGDPWAPARNCEDLQKCFLEMLWLAAGDNPFRQPVAIACA